jgi:hypothetical protein
MQLKFPENISVLAKPGARLGFVGIVAALILLAIAQTITPIVTILPLEEYRSPAPRPRVFQTLLHGDGRLAGQINAWFDDQMGFRALLTKLSNQIDYSVFSYSKKVIIGEKGWLFGPSDWLQSVLHARLGGDLKVERAKLNELKEFLKRRNIRLVVMSTPSKETFYREYFPTARLPGPKVTEFEKFRSYLKSGDGRDWIYIDSQDILAKAKAGGEDMYLRTDPHLSSIGNFLVAKEMVKRIALAEGVEASWDPAIEFAKTKFEVGAYTRYLALFDDVSEQALFPKIPFNQEKLPAGESVEKSPAKPFEIIFHNSNDAKLPRMVLFGNSFLDWYIALGVYSNFKDVYRARGVSNEIGPVLGAIPPGTRYFVYQFWEPHFLALRYAPIPAE